SGIVPAIVSAVLTLNRLPAASGKRVDQEERGLEKGSWKKGSESFFAASFRGGEMGHCEK
ncbi:MAG: hypothetical protein MI785_07990, partial [Kiloniellales bacterium]|nr:hypothetical protein [Kiloniellales bacterium]